MPEKNEKVCTMPQSPMQITWSAVGRFSHDLITLRQKETWKLWDLCESLIVYILLRTFQWIHMALAVKRPNARRFIAWIKPADWKPWQWNPSETKWQLVLALYVKKGIYAWVNNVMSYICVDKQNLTDRILIFWPYFFFLSFTSLVSFMKFTFRYPGTGCWH